MTLQPHFKNWELWSDRCLEILQLNEVVAQGNLYSRPAPHVYEYQWLWDSCFHAIVYRWVDPLRAQQELISLIQHQLITGDDAGMIPHMAYWNGGGFQLWGVDDYSIITQPPLIAVAALRVFEKSQDVQFLRTIYPAIRRFHQWFDSRRDPDGDSLVSLIHPWESGWDASPRWDRAMGLGASPTDEESKQARHDLVRMLQEMRCDVNTLQNRGSFCVEAMDYNAIRAADLECLAEIAERIGFLREAALHRNCARAIQLAVQQKMVQGDTAYDLFGADELRGTENSAAQFVLLFGGCLTDVQAASFVKRLQSNSFWTKYPVPTTPVDVSSFNGGHYWRGNVWMSVNWLIYSGLRCYGYTELATELALRCLQLVDQSGFYEYFNPQTGEGLGPSQYGWTTLVLDMLGLEMSA